jgi:hypothetical protein
MYRMQCFCEPCSDIRCRVQQSVLHLPTISVCFPVRRGYFQYAGVVRLKGTVIVIIVSTQTSSARGSLLVGHSWDGRGIEKSVDSGWLSLVINV